MQIVTVARKSDGWNVTGAGAERRFASGAQAESWACGFALRMADRGSGAEVVIFDQTGEPLAALHYAPAVPRRLMWAKRATA